MDSHVEVKNLELVYALNFRGREVAVYHQRNGTYPKIILEFPGDGIRAVDRFIRDVKLPETRPVAFSARVFHEDAAAPYTSPNRERERHERMTREGQFTDVRSPVIHVKEEKNSVPGHVKRLELSVSREPQAHEQWPLTPDGIRAFLAMQYDC